MQASISIDNLPEKICIFRIVLFILLFIFIKYRSRNHFIIIISIIFIIILHKLLNKIIKKNKNSKIKPISNSISNPQYCSKRYGYALDGSDI